MKTLIITSLLVIMTSGCATQQMAKLAKQLKDDSATVQINIRTIYGTLYFSRTNPKTNTMPHSVTADGNVTVKP